MRKPDVRSLGATRTPCTGIPNTSCGHRPQVTEAAATPAARSGRRTQKTGGRCSHHGLRDARLGDWSEKAVRLAQRCKLAHAFLREYNYKRLKLAQLLGQLGVFLTWLRDGAPRARGLGARARDGDQTPSLHLHPCTPRVLEDVDVRALAHGSTGVLSLRACEGACTQASSARRAHTPRRQPTSQPPGSAS
jgi:hypothetical protein